jgi:deoxyhypusine synthase
MKKIEPIKIREGMSVRELVSDMEGTGFGGGKVAKASRIMKEMFSDSDCKIFFGAAGALVPAGMRDVLIDMLSHVDVFVTTGAMLTHDLVEALGESHYLTESPFNDMELNKKGLDRMYNVLMENKVYEKLESFFERNWEEFQKCSNIKELLWKIGELTPSRSLLKVCYEKKIPVFCPALADSGIGLMIWGRLMAGKEIKIDAFDDMKEIIDIAWGAKKSGVIYLGGGVPKNFIQQALQFSKGADYGVQITVDREVFGGSSGAPLKEGISWGKMNPNANFIDVICDVTIALPLVFGGMEKF